MPSKKHYIITAITLGAIAAASGVLIGAANLITRDQIKKNEAKKFNAGIVAIFGEGAYTSDFSPNINDGYLVSSYHVNNEDNSVKGWAVVASGSNMYGKISLIAGFDYDTKAFKGIYVTTNEQTYASTLVDNYINPLNNGDVQLDDVSCGATYGAKLVRDLVNASQSYVDGIIYD